MGTFQNFLTAIIILIAIIILFASSVFDGIGERTGGAEVTGIPPTWLVLVIAIALIFIIQQPRMIMGWFRRK